MVFKDLPAEVSQIFHLPSRRKKMCGCSSPSFTKKISLSPPFPVYDSLCPLCGLNSANWPIPLSPWLFFPMPVIVIVWFSPIPAITEAVYFPSYSWFFFKIYGHPPPNTIPGSTPPSFQYNFPIGHPRQSLKDHLTLFMKRWLFPQRHSTNFPPNFEFAPPLFSENFGTLIRESFCSTPLLFFKPSDPSLFPPLFSRKVVSHPSPPLYHNVKGEPWSKLPP